MKILIVGSRDPHYGSDFLYVGLRKVLGEADVLLIPGKKSLGFPLFGFPWACGIDLSTQSSFSNACEFWDIVIHVCPLSRDPHGDTVNILDSLPSSVPVILIDQEDWFTGPDQFYTGSHPVLAVYHRENQDSDRPEKTFPMCYNSDLGIFPYERTIRDIDLFCILSRTSEARRDLCTFLQAHKWPTGFKPEILVGNGRPVSMSTYYSLLRRSKMAISDTGGGQDTNRFYEILCNGAALLSRHVTLEFDHKPQDGKEAVYWHTFDDLINQIEFLYKNQDRIAEVAMAGYKLGVTYHTEVARARFIVSEAERLLKESQ